MRRSSVSTVIGAVARFFSSFRFPTLALSTILLFHLSLGLVLVLPLPDGGALGAFARDFRTWCFGWDAKTGTYEWAYVGMTALEPLVLGAAILFVWYAPLAEVVRSAPRRLVPWGLGGASIVVGLAALLFRVGVPRPTADDGHLPHGLRTSLPAPALALVDQESAKVSLDELRGRVVVLTGVYASCHSSCPMILGQAKRALDALDEPTRREVTVVAVTMDPEHDTPAVLARLATAQLVSAPTFRLATGAPDAVNDVLDRIGVTRQRDPETGVIDHTNVFAVIDRRGRLAYRFSLGDVQERWLVEALRELVGERLEATAQR